MKSHIRKLIISEGVNIVYDFPTSISMRTGTTWVDFTKSTERHVRYCFPLPIPNTSTNVMFPTKILVSTHNLL